MASSGILQGLASVSAICPVPVQSPRRAVKCCAGVRVPDGEVLHPDLPVEDWRMHKPICKAARQPGGITQQQALSFMLS